MCQKLYLNCTEYHSSNFQHDTTIYHLTLMRATSGSLARCGGGGRHPPYLSWLWSKYWPKNHVSLRAGINSNSFCPFSEFFFQNLQKNWRKLKTYQKLLKMSENSKFCNFWAISTCNTSKESIFHIQLYTFTYMPLIIGPMKMKSLRKSMIDLNKAKRL